MSRKLEMVSAEISVAVERLDVGERLGVRQADDVIESIRKNFTPSWNGTGPAWEHFEESTRAIHEPEGWRRIGELPFRPVYLLISLGYSAPVWSFTSGTEVVQVLAECFGFEFFCASEDTRAVVCFNDHDWLIGAGDALDWI